MYITKIEELSKTQKRVWIDESFAFVLYKGELRLYGIREGEQLKEEVFREITEVVLVKRAKLRCMNLLKARPYTEKQLRDKLKQGGYLEEAVDKALDYVKSYGYVNDEAYAAEYIRCQSASRSRRKIEEELARKGVEREIVEEAFRQAEEDGDGVDEEALARTFLAKKHYNPEEADYMEQQKMAAFLFRKGIPGEVIRRVIRPE